MNAFRNLFNSTVRTVVPSIVGFCLAWLATTGMEIDSSLSNALTGALTVGFNIVYYVVVRFLETKFSSQWGWLLGLATSPEYVNPMTIDAVEKHSEEFFKNNSVG